MKIVCSVYSSPIGWQDAKRAYLKFNNNKITMRHIEKNPCTLRYTYSYSISYTSNIHRITDYHIQI